MAGDKCGPRQAPRALPIRPLLVFYMNPSVCLSFYVDIGMVAPENSTAQNLRVWSVFPLL